MNKQLVLSWLKVFLSSILTLIVIAGDIWSLNWREIISAGVVSTLPVIINFLNPNDTRYGNVKPPTNE